MKRRLALYGPNELAETPPVPAWKRLLGHFKDVVVLILIGAAVVSGIAGDLADTLAILTIVLLNGILGFLQEDKAQRALAALQKLSAPSVKVLRGGTRMVVPAAAIVPGDVIELEAGDYVPADARLLSAIALRMQESALTGESVPVEKDPGVVLPAATPLGDRRNMVYMGTVAATGKAAALVVATAMNTELGRIAAMLQRAEPEPTPLQRRLSQLGNVMVVVCLVLVAVIFFIRMLQGGNLLEVFLTSVSLAVAAVPEGMPAVVTLALAIGVQRMVRRNALIRKLPSVETLGSVTVICSDKTGTLTRNEMTVRSVVAGMAQYELSGSGYLPRGEFRLDGAVIQPGQHAALMQLLRIGLYCNNSSVAPLDDGSGNWQIIGDPTEAALLIAARKAGLEGRAEGDRILSEIPFDSDRKAMSVVVRSRAGTLQMFTKGAPEVVLGMCSALRIGDKVEPLTDAHRSRILERNNALSASALRVLAFAYRDDPVQEDGAWQESGLVFAGVVGMIDPPREEAKAAVKKCHAAGIRPVMITGDHPATALAIARELDIAAGDGRVLTGAELDLLSDGELQMQVDTIPVYARVSAEHKLRIVRAWKQRGEIVAMTGDGVNDAPAIRSADIGIAMGRSGTDVTRDAAAMVLTDDNFASIVSAVEEGRGIFDNIQKFIQYLLATNAGELLLLFFAALAGWPAPLLPIQILWINLVTDGLPALSLAMEPPEKDIMKRKPLPPRAPVISSAVGISTLVKGIMIAAVGAIGFALEYQGGDGNLGRARTMAFCVMAFSQLSFALAFRSQRYTMPELGLFSNPYLFAALALSSLLQLTVVTLPVAQPVFEATPHFGADWFIILGLALAPVTIVEVSKLVRAFVRAARQR